ncbi:MAG: NAD(P)H-dependent oxidoreductase subunit E [Candidatus Latescibacteria bacterium]|nr:NAD(P)H-dependent oxidoreductase subunit E [Candidatus Latescibacterota bacterium]
MPATTDRELTEHWRREPAPLLPLLHAFHDRDGYLSDAALRATSQALAIPLAELYGTVTFYHHFSRTPGGRDTPRVCTGPVCARRGGQHLLAQLAGRGAIPMPCAGRCDAPIPVLVGSQVQVGADAEGLAPHASLLPAPNPGGTEECVFAQIRQPDRARLEGYRRSGGYEGLQRALAMTPAALIAELIESKLAGRGGAGFPTGLKWRAVAEATGTPKTVVCNADEGDPGCFKDRAVLDYDPHAVIEGMLIAAWATGATRGFIYLRYEYPETYRLLESALAEAEAAGLLGEGILGRPFSFRLYLRRGAGAYICGEEGALLNSLEGKRPFPRNRPPFPVTHGFEDLPTVVNNVETLASVPQILRRGAAWYQGLGLKGQAGTKLISLSGDIQRPGNYEIPLGLPLGALLHEWAGGPLPGRSIQALTMAGLSGGFLAGKDLDTTLDEHSIRAKGSFLGAGGIMVFDDRRDMVEVARDAIAFFAEESCGKCFPCRIGTQRLSERLAGVAGPRELAAWTAEVHDIGRVMKALSACGLGMAAPHVTESLLRYFPEQVARHVQKGPRP